MKLLNLKEKKKDIDKPLRKKDGKEKGNKKDKKTILSKVLNVVGIVICILLIPVLIVNGTLLFKSVIHPDTPPDFMGYVPLVVSGGNVSFEFDNNDLVIIKNSDDANELEVGSIISFWADNNSIITQKIVDTEIVGDQQILYVIKDDANSEDLIHVAPDQILGVYKTHIDDIGSFVLFMQTPAGIVTLVVLPLLIIFLVFYFRDKKRYEAALKREREKNERENNVQANETALEDNVNQQSEVQV